MIPVFETKAKKVVSQWRQKFDEVGLSREEVEIPVQDFMTRIVGLSLHPFSLEPQKIITTF